MEANIGWWIRLGRWIVGLFGKKAEQKPLFQSEGFAEAVAQGVAREIADKINVDGGGASAKTVTKLKGKVASLEAANAILKARLEPGWRQEPVVAGDRPIPYLLAPAKLGNNPWFAQEVVAVMLCRDGDGRWFVDVAGDGTRYELEDVRGLWWGPIWFRDLGERRAPEPVATWGENNDD